MSQELKWDLFKIGFGALLGFFFSLVGVWAQRRADRRERAQDSLAQRRAFATALLYEVTSFADSFLQPVKTIVQEISDPTGQGLQKLTVVSPTSFPLYDGSSSWIGRLSKESVSEIVEFYTLARAFVEGVSRLNESYRWEAGRPHGRIEERADCVKQFRELKERVGPLESAATTARKRLRDEAALPPEKSQTASVGTDTEVPQT